MAFNFSDYKPDNDNGIRVVRLHLKYTMQYMPFYTAINSHWDDYRGGWFQGDNEINNLKFLTYNIPFFTEALTKDGFIVNPEKCYAKAEGNLYHSITGFINIECYYVINPDSKIIDIPQISYKQLLSSIHYDFLEQNQPSLSDSIFYFNILDDPKNICLLSDIIISNFKGQCIYLKNIVERRDYIRFSFSNVETRMCLNDAIDIQEHVLWYILGNTEKTSIYFDKQCYSFLNQHKKHYENRTAIKDISKYPASKVKELNEYKKNYLIPIIESYQRNNGI